MEFVDTVTPSSGRSYWREFEDFSPRAAWNKRDEQTARDYMALHYQNAYNTALMNYQNQYNSPLQQMLRYQEAGLNPFLASSDAGNMGSSIAGASPRGSSAVTPSGTEIANSVNQSINSLTNALKTAQQIYDYVNFGRDISAEQEQLAHFNANIAQYRALGEEAETAWKRYWNLGEQAVPEVSTDPTVQTSPRAVYMDQSTQRISAQVDQLKSLVDVLYPSQADANEARKALTLYQKQVMEGQNNAILNLDTGNPERDAIIKQVLFWLQNRLQVKL